MKQQLEPLFTPWKIGNCEIKNRIVLTSMGGTNLLGWMEVNHFDKDGAKFILEVAKIIAVWCFRDVSRYTIPCTDSGCIRRKKCMRICQSGCQSSTRQEQSCSSS